MTDRIHALTVTLDKDIREDDVQGLVDAIRHMRHVIKVSKEVTSEIAAHTERIRIATDLHDRFKTIVDELWGK